MKKLIRLLLLLLPISAINGATQKNTASKLQDAEKAFDLGVQAYYDYNFEEAEDYFSQYRKLQEKKKKPVDEELSLMELQLKNSKGAIDRVEKIIVIDSLLLPRATFYNDYRLSSSSGKIVEAKVLEDKPQIDDETTVYVNEWNDYMIWPSADDNGLHRLYEGTRLLNGEWDVRAMDLTQEDDTADIIYPFLSGDGQTLYFTMSGEESLGGYDIFMVQRDPISGEFRQPLNLGMPYNSPFDDLMMAIDEESGIGWWATDRHNEEDTVTVYVYLLNDLRQNYPSDSEDIVIYARLDDYKLTQPEGKEKVIKEALAAIPKENKERKEKVKDFTLPMGKGKVYSNFSDFRNNKASQEMKVYLKKKNELEESEAQLAEMRRKYAGKEKNLIPKIEELEEKVESLKHDVSQALSMVYRLEKSTR